MPKKKKKSVSKGKGKPPSLFNRVWKIFVGISIAATFLYWLYTTFLKSEHAQFIDEKKISHEIKSPKISEFKFQPIENQPPLIFRDTASKYPPVSGIRVPGLKNDLMPTNIQIGGHIHVIPSATLYNGLRLITTPEEYELPVVDLIAKDDRLYVSAKFLDLENEFEIGEMNFNHWSLYKENLLDYNYDDKKLEVIDKRGNIVFSMAYEYSINTNSRTSAFVVIAGYFISPKRVMVLNNLEYFNNGTYVNDHETELFDKSEKDYKNKALVEIRKIRSIF